MYIGAQALARRVDARAQLFHVQHFALSAVYHVQNRVRWGRWCGLARALLRPLLPVQNIGAGNLVVAATHEAQLDMVLHIFNMEGATAGARAHQCAGDLMGQGLYRLAHAGRRSALGSVNRKKGFHQRNRNFVGLKRYDCTIAADDLVMRQRTLCRSSSFKGRRKRRGGAAQVNGCGGCSEHKTRFLCYFEMSQDEAGGQSAHRAST